MASSMNYLIGKQPNYCGTRLTCEEITNLLVARLSSVIPYGREKRQSFTRSPLAKCPLIAIGGNDKAIPLKKEIVDLRKTTDGKDPYPLPEEALQLVGVRYIRPPTSGPKSGALGPTGHRHL